MKYIIVNIKDINKIIVIFEDTFLDGNEFYTENRLNEVLGLVFTDFSVALMVHEKKEVE